MPGFPAANGLDGVGGGLVLDGHLFPGRTSNGGALGSMPAYAGGDRSGRGPQLMNVASIYVLERKLIAAGRNADVLWRQPATGLVGFWFMDGGTVVHTATFGVGTGWAPIGAG